MKKNLRQEMPTITAIVDMVREIAGKEAVDQNIRAGLNGKPLFWARENGHELGTRDTSQTSVIRYDERDLPYLAEPHWMTDARIAARRLGISIPPANKNNPKDVEREAQALRNVLEKAKQNPAT
jgi:hypothetical protein